jgi:hypothetical protein
MHSRESASCPEFDDQQQHFLLFLSFFLSFRPNMFSESCPDLAVSKSSGLLPIFARGKQLENIVRSGRLCHFVTSTKKDQLVAESRKRPRHDADWLSSCNWFYLVLMPTSVTFSAVHRLLLMFCVQRSIFFSCSMRERERERRRRRRVVWLQNCACHFGGRRLFVSFG